MSEMKDAQQTQEARPVVVGAAAVAVGSHRQVFVPMDIAEMMNQAPWWVVSLVIHGILLIVLATISFTAPTSPRKMVIIDTDQVELLDPELAVTKHLPDDLSGTLENPSLEENARREKDIVICEVPVTRPDVISVPDIAHLVEVYTGFGVDPSAVPDPLKKIAAARPIDIPTVVDALAGEILKEIQKHDLLVVMLFDESRSLLEDRKLIARRVKKTVTDLQKEMTLKERERLRWAMVSYGEKPTMWLQPTGDLKAVVESADNVKVDMSGRENVVEAINFTMRNFAPLRKRMFLLLVTDEEGNDVGKTEEVNKALQAMATTETKLFVFGREASFQLAKVREWLRDKNGERVGPWNYADRGLESCGLEFFPPDWFWNAQHSYNGVPSGFGCWVQSMLARETGGTYFVLSDTPMKYDEEVMEDYKPEWDPKRVYEKRTQVSRLRQTMVKLFADYKAVRPAHWLTQLDRIKAQTKEENKKARDLLKLVERAIDELEPLKSQSRKEKFAPKRWQANYDLTMAQLHKLKFQAHEYIEVTDQALQKGFPKPKKRQKFNLFAVTCDP